MFGRFLMAAAIAALAAPASASVVPVEMLAVNDSGDTAWILTASALVLLVTLPGLGLFYGGGVRASNFLSVLLQIGAVAAIASVLWVVIGYTLAFGPVGNGVIGTGLNRMLAELGNVRFGSTIPESAFVLFQMAFAIVTPALMIGAWVERARFGWVVGFCALWGLVVYAPIAHWVWGGGWLASRFGTLDFAGGLVVHTTAGVSALVVALLLGRRLDWPQSLVPPYAPAMRMAGAALLWAVWLGLIGGSALAATDDASAAIINAHVAASMAALVWLLVEKFTMGKPTSVGWATGAIAGFATMAPAAGFVSPGAAMLFGALGAIVCYGAIRLVKQRLAIDDSLDVFAIHGVGGMLGSVLLAFFLSDALGGTGYAEGMSLGRQLVAQIAGVGAVVLWSAVASAILALMVGLIFPMRASEDEEREGLDIASHGEQAGKVHRRP